CCRRSSPGRRSASAVLSDDDAALSLSTHPSTDGSDPLTLRTLDSTDGSNEQQALTTVRLLRERIAALEVAASSREDAFSQQAARVTELQGSLQQAQAALQAASRGPHSGSSAEVSRALQRQNSLETRLAQEQEAAGKLRQQLRTTTSSLDERTRAVDECEARIRRLTAEVAALTREVTEKDAEILGLHQRLEPNGINARDGGAGPAASPKAARHVVPASSSGAGSTAGASVSQASGSHLRTLLSTPSPASICSSTTGPAEAASLSGSPHASGEESASISMSPSRASSLDMSAGDMTPTRSGTPHAPQRRDREPHRDPHGAPLANGSGPGHSSFSPTLPGAPPPGFNRASTAGGPAFFREGLERASSGWEAGAAAEPRDSGSRPRSRAGRAFGSEILVAPPSGESPNADGMIAALRRQPQASAFQQTGTPLQVTRASSVPITGPLSIPGLLGPETLGLLSNVARLTMPAPFNSSSSSSSSPQGSYPSSCQASCGTQPSGIRQPATEIRGISVAASRGSRLMGPLGAGHPSSSQQLGTHSQHAMGAHRAGSYPALSDLAGQAKGGYSSAEGRIEMLRTSSEQIFRSATPVAGSSGRDIAALPGTDSPTANGLPGHTSLGRPGHVANGMVSFAQQAKDDSSSGAPFRTFDSSQRPGSSARSSHESPGLDDFAHMGLINDLLE
ncbi:hypothetical protein WJX84_008656, partial [Apatococcus fuscideae]